MASSVLNDEPALVDKLNREKYARSFARLSEICETPLVIGLYGTWGTGKTSLMRLIEARLDKRKVIPIWFDPWQHQFDESPVLALLHTLTTSAQLDSEAAKLLTVIATAFGSLLLKATTTLSLKDIDEIGERLERERFMVRETQVRLREHFQALVKRAQGVPAKRLVFFVDDLDRCLPSHIMRVLESLKLYLNLSGCIYFLGVDRDALECSIRFQYKDLDLSERSYLDKIVQLPFTIPPVLYDSMGDFVQHLLPTGLKSCRDLLATGLGENPREIKRVVNTLIFNDELARSAGIRNYEPRLLAALLLLQHRDAVRYRQISSSPQLFFSLVKEEEPSHIELREKDPKLAQALLSLKAIKERDLKSYIYLSQLVSLTKDEGSSRFLDLTSAVTSHIHWLESGGKEGSVADLRNYNLAETSLDGLNLTQGNLRGANLKRASLVNTLLMKADLAGADLAGAKLSGTNLQEANLSRANLTEADLESVKLGGADLSEANFSRATFDKRAKNQLKAAKLIRTIFSGANLSGADLSNCNCSEGDFRDTLLSNAQLTEAIFREANLSKAVLESADLDRADLSYAMLDGCNLVKVKAQRTNFRNASMKGANLSKALFCKSDLRDCDLKAAILVGTNLTGADLSGADLQGANLTGCIVAEVDFSGSLLLNCDLRECIGLTQQQIYQGIVNDSTRVPIYFDH